MPFRIAGISGWPEALRLAEWPTDRPVWSVSCPCPPFSVAGQSATCPSCESSCLVWCPRRTGFAICADCENAWLADARHLWPEVWRLTAECRPRHIFGEQVDSVTSRDWLAAVQASLEILGYDTRAEGLPASCVGAFHIRQRLWWMSGLLNDSGERMEPRVGRSLVRTGSNHNARDWTWQGLRGWTGCDDTASARLSGETEPRTARASRDEARVPEL